MTNPTDTNQASEDEQAMQHICQQTGEHYYASESIPGGLIHWIRICMTCGHKDDKDLNEQVKTLIADQVAKARIDERTQAQQYLHGLTITPESQHLFDVLSRDNHNRIVTLNGVNNNGYSNGS